MSDLKSATASGVATPSDTTALDFDRVYVGGTGHVNISHDGGKSTTLFSGVQGGTTIDVKGNRIMSTSTTATLIVWMRY